MLTGHMRSQGHSLALAHHADQIRSRPEVGRDARPGSDHMGARSMIVLITADLHLDLWACAGRDPFVGIVPVLRDLDALIIAGDLANDPQRNWPWALARITRLVSAAQVWVVPGNHDYYGATLDDGPLDELTV